MRLKFGAATVHRNEAASVLQFFSGNALEPEQTAGMLAGLAVRPRARHTRSNMNVTFRTVSSFSLLAASALAQITPGNLVVMRVGDGSAALTNAATAVFLEEYTPAGTLVQTLPMPTAASGANLPITNAGSATSEGFVTQSVDGRYLVSVGYAAPPGTPGIVATASATTQRVIARIALDGTIDTTTGLTDAYSASNIRSATSTDGNDFWTAGTGSTGNRGVCYVGGLGATTSTQLSTSVTNLRVVNIANGQLYVSSASGAFLGVSTVGTGLPTAAGETVTLLPGFGAASGAYDYWFADASTLYVADDRTAATGGGIQKWTESAGTWTLQYTLAPGTVGCRGLTGYVDNGVVTLFATTTEANANRLVTVVDTGATSTITNLVTGAANTALRGVRFVRTPYSISHSGTGCATSVGVPTVGTANGLPVLGNLNFRITAGNTPANTVVLWLLSAGTVSPVGFPLPGTPACVLLYMLPDALPLELADANGDASTPVSIPASQALVGFALGAQVAAFDLTLVGFDLPIGTSDALQLVLGN